MKKSLLALAAISLAGAASAQSSVTLFGIVDAAYGHVSAGGKSVSGISNSGLNSSRIGFRGVEDLGGGLKANFWLEGALSNDDGNAAGLTFQRRSYVGLSGGFGEVRIGREYTPSFWNTTVYDPFGTNGVGSANTFNLISAAPGAPGNITNGVRSNNMITYLLPAMGGFVGQGMVGFGENSGAATPTDSKRTNNYLGFRFGYAAGPLSAHVAFAKTKAVTPGGANDTKYQNIGASYDFGAVKPMFFWGTEKTGSGAKVTGWELGAVAPMGQGELRAAISRYDVANSANDWSKFALGYGYNLSKRTQLYTTYARVSNKGAQVKTVSNNGLAVSPNTATPGGGSNGYEFGVRHVF